MHRRTRLALGAGLLLALGPVTVVNRADPPGFIDDFRWTSDDPSFGGWSGLEITDAGRHLVALSDRGAWVEADISRNPEGRIDRITTAPVRGLNGISGTPLPPDSRDSEGLAIAADGTAYVSFEGPARVMRFPGLGESGTLLPSAPDFVELLPNGSLESLAVDAEGTLYTLPEETPRSDGLTPLFRFRNGVWDRPWFLPVDATFYPAGADIGPDGRLYVIERQFRGLAGFVSRLRRFTFGAERILPGETLFTSDAGRFGNLESVAVWRAADGGLRATMVSDDNFIDPRGTELVEVRLPD